MSNILQGRNKAMAALKRVNGELVKIQHKLNGADELRRDFTSNLARIQRDVLQFDSPISIIVAMGMLKAGKSTLVNVLARCGNASPTGYGYDTTLRPALIRECSPNDPHSATGRIVVYHFNAAAVGQQMSPEEQEAEETRQRNQKLCEVLDFLRNIGAGQTFNTTVLDLTEKNLQNTLCCSVNDPNALNTLQGNEPLIVMVETPCNKDSKLLKDGRMLLDMPGLDSAQSETSCHFERYQALIDECDAALFVQSSVAPLNDKAQDQLKESLKRRHAATIYVVQNQMLSKPWLDSEVNAEAQKRQLARALDLVKKLAMDVSGVAPKQFQVNLGMASDSLFVPKNQYHGKYVMEGLDEGQHVSSEMLWKCSEMDALEQALVQNIQQNGIRNRIRHCCDNLNVHVKKFIAGIDAERANNENSQKNKRSDKIVWEGIQEDVKESMSDYTFGEIQDAHFKRPEDIHEQAFQEAEAEAPLKMVNEKGSAIDNHLKKYAIKMKEQCLKALETWTLGKVKVELAGKKPDSAFNICNNTLTKLLQRWQGDGKYESREKKRTFFNELNSDQKPNSDYELNESKCKLDIKPADFKEYTPARKFEAYYIDTRLIKWEKKYQNDGVTHAWDPEVKKLKENYINELKRVLNDKLRDCMQRVLDAEAPGAIKPLTEALAERVKALEKELSELQVLMKGMEDITHMLKNVENDIPNLKA